jgi:hypothetical protein
VLVLLVLVLEAQAALQRSPGQVALAQALRQWSAKVRDVVKLLC